jgi:uncharacterized membrane protein YbhN (UPF0104 family)
VTDTIMRRFNLILLAVATVFLLGMLRELGWANLGRYFLQVGYYWPLLLVPYGLVNCLGTISWSYLLPDRATRPSFSRLFFLRLAGDSLNQLTPTASVGGEAFRALRLKALGVLWEQATASVVIQKGILVLSLVLYVFSGLTLSVFLLDLNASRMGALSAATLILGAASVAFVILQHRGPCVLGIRLLEKCGLCPAKLRAKEQELAALDLCLAGFYREHPGRGFLAFMLFYLSWLVHGVEVYVIFRLLGHPINWGLAICLDALATLISALGFMIPASVGVQDGGAVLLSLGFNLGATLGAAFSVMRRIREAFWLSLGLLVVARQK